MAVIYTKTTRHRNTSNPVLPAAGTDTHSFTVPTQQKYSHFNIQTLNGHALSGYSIKSKPKAGAVGSRSIRVDWWYAPFGQVHYKIVVHGKPKSSTTKPPAQSITFGAVGWFEETMAAIDQGLDFNIVLKGPAATELFNAIRGPSVSGAVDPVITPGVVIVITLAVAFVVVSLAAFALIGAVLIVAIRSGYNARAHYKGSSNPLAAELEIRVTKA